MRDPSSLRPHPSNAGIYGDDPDEAFIANVRMNGVLTPVVATPDGMLVSGHRRHAAAIAAGLAEVPVIVREFADDLAVLECLIASNAQRQKNNLQLGREALAIKGVELERSRRNQAANLKNVGAKGSDLAGRWRERAAEMMGVGERRVREASVVVERIDELTALGDSDGAAALAESLLQSAHGAFESIRVPEAEKSAPPSDALSAKPKRHRFSRKGVTTEADIAAAEDHLPKFCPAGVPLEFVEEKLPFWTLEQFDEVQKLARQLIDRVRALAQENGGEGLAHDASIGHGKPRDGRPHLIVTDVQNLIKILERNRPAARYCPVCAAKNKPDNRKDCKTCGGLPYVTARVWSAANDEEKERAIAQQHKK